jgi:hypothetical protein
MNPPDFRALCAELIRLSDEPLGDYSSWHHRWHTACAETRAALAQPVGDAKSFPSDYIDPEHTGADHHLLEVFYRACHAEGGTADEIHLRGLRAVLTDAALAQPVAEGPTDAGIESAFRCWFSDRFGGAYFGAIPLVTCIEWTQFALARWGHPTPQPIPVSERLPSLIDCAPWPGEPDYFPWCWAGGDIDGNWKWIQLTIGHLSSDQLTWVMRGEGCTHWAPHWAFPVPAAPAAEEVQA